MRVRLHIRFSILYTNVSNKFKRIIYHWLFLTRYFFKNQNTKWDYNSTKFVSITAIRHWTSGKAWRISFKFEWEPDNYSLIKLLFCSSFSYLLLCFLHFHHWTLPALTKGQRMGTTRKNISRSNDAYFDFGLPGSQFCNT